MRLISLNSVGKKVWLFVMSDALVMAKPKNKKTAMPQVTSPRTPPLGQKVIILALLALITFRNWTCSSGHQTPFNDYVVKHVEYLKELSLLSIPTNGMSPSTIATYQFCVPLIF